MKIGHPYLRDGIKQVSSASREARSRAFAGPPSGTGAVVWVWVRREHYEQMICANRGWVRLRKQLRFGGRAWKSIM